MSVDATTPADKGHWTLHAVQAVLIAGATPLFLGALLSDLAYNSSYEMQWSNFATWLLVGAMVFTGLALLWSVVELIRSRQRHAQSLACFALLAMIFVLGLLNSFVHARDAWATMPQGLVLSLIISVLSVAVTFLGFASFRRGDRR